MPITCLNPNKEFKVLILIIIQSPKLHWELDNPNFNRGSLRVLVHQTLDENNRHRAKSEITVVD